MNERLLRARLDAETKPRVDLWRKRQAEKRDDIWVVVAWTIFVISGILTGFLVEYLF